MNSTTPQLAPGLHGAALNLFGGSFVGNLLTALYVSRPTQTSRAAKLTRFVIIFANACHLSDALVLSRYSSGGTLTYFERTLFPLES